MIGFAIETMCLKTAVAVRVAATDTVAVLILSLGVLPEEESKDSPISTVPRREKIFQNSIPVFLF